MKYDSKLTLSAEEQELVENTEWILTKHVIIDKVYAVMGVLSEQYKSQLVKATLPINVIQSSPKIARGENYLQLPYVLLDYPRCFGTEDVFAVRTMFWWGKFFSITLQLSGIYKTMFCKQFIQKKEMLGQKEFYLCISDDQWQHHFEETNYYPVKKIVQNEFEDLLLKKEFLKLSVKFPLHQWNEIPALLEETFADMLWLLKD